jgi:hypothetical protein
MIFNLTDLNGKSFEILAQTTVAGGLIKISNGIDYGLYRINSISLGTYCTISTIPYIASLNIFSGAVVVEVFPGIDASVFYTYSTGIVRLGAGTTSSCALQRLNDSNTGIYFPAADSLSIVTGGITRINVTNSSIACNVNLIASAGISFESAGTLTNTADGQISVSSTFALPTGLGTVGATPNVPRLHPSGDLDTGIYFPAANQVAVRTGGSNAVVISSNYPSISANYLFNFDAEITASLLTQVSTAPGDGSVIGPRTSVAADGWTFYGMARAMLNTSEVVWVALYNAVEAPEE